MKVKINKFQNKKAQIKKKSNIFEKKERQKE